MRVPPQAACCSISLTSAAGAGAGVPAGAAPTLREHVTVHAVRLALVPAVHLADITSSHDASFRRMTALCNVRSRGSCTSLFIPPFDPSRRAIARHCTSNPYEEGARLRRASSYVTADGYM